MIDTNEKCGTADINSADDRDQTSRWQKVRGKTAEFALFDEMALFTNPETATTSVA